MKEIRPGWWKHKLALGCSWQFQAADRAEAEAKVRKQEDLLAKRLDADKRGNGQLNQRALSVKGKYIVKGLRWL